MRVLVKFSPFVQILWLLLIFQFSLCSWPVCRFVFISGRNTADCWSERCSGSGLLKCLQVSPCSADGGYYLGKFHSLPWWSNHHLEPYKWRIKLWPWRYNSFCIPRLTTATVLKSSLPGFVASFIHDAFLFFKSIERFRIEAGAAGYTLTCGCVHGALGTRFATRATRTALTRHKAAGIYDWQKNRCHQLSRSPGSTKWPAELFFDIKRSGPQAAGRSRRLPQGNYMYISFLHFTKKSTSVQAVVCWHLMSTWSENCYLTFFQATLW